MKKLFAMMLAAAMCLSLCVPAFAAEDTIISYSILQKEWKTGATQFRGADGNIYISVKTIEPDGRLKSVVSGPTGSAEVIRDANSITITTTALDGTVSQVTNMLNTPSCFQAESLRTVTEIAGEEWGFHCRTNDSREATLGILWTLSSEDGTHAAYDDNNTTYRGYAEDFWDQIISMNASIRSAKSIMISIGISGIQTIVNAFFGVAGTLEAVYAVLDTFNCGYESAQAWKKAREYANRANYDFARYRNATQSSTQMV